MTDINLIMNKKIGIYKVQDKHKDLTNRMSKKLDEGLNLPKDDEVKPETDVEGGLGLDNTEPMIDQPAEDEDALDLDSLSDEEPVTDTEISPEPVTDVPPADIAPSTEPTEEIDVTEFIEKGENLTQKVDDQVKAMTDQLNMLTQKLSTMDQMIGKIQQVEDEIQALKPPKPIETLRLRSLDSYPYNQGLDDYWKKKEVEVEKLRDFNRVGQKNEFVLTNDDVNTFSDIEVKDSFSPNNPSSVSPFPGPKTNQDSGSIFNRQKV